MNPKLTALFNDPQEYRSFKSFFKFLRGITTYTYESGSPMALWVEWGVDNNYITVIQSTACGYKEGLVTYKITLSEEGESFVDFLNL